ncbi:cysteine-type deubiquitinase [Emydomyces testavorans]|uniref:ubiquitinyl hydrolase 1 n=1 Tax=Emydomyces testavorans TaxID=2070801 RepID=A0AAF0IJX7_9EURO|nr:cysteine-type deubiquitinase [Emydomyces testavorans]
MTEHPEQQNLKSEVDYNASDDSTAASMMFDKAVWHGFCEIESEPALFNVMLRDWGVKGVKVQEVVSLDREMLGFLQYTVNCACASVALLNIINNIDDVDIGEQLHHFKAFTMEFTPALRGDAISNFKFVKQVHNSFARRMDILNADLQLKNDSTVKKSKASKRNQSFDESEAGFHFIAFVPANGKVWKFDGLERQPQSLGNYIGEDWLELARPEIQSRMAEYEEDQIEFSILSLVRDPIIEIVNQLALNVKSLITIDEQLSNCPTLSGLDCLDDGTVTGPDLSLNLTQSILEKAAVPEDDLQRYKTISRDCLLSLRKALVDAQKAIRASIKEEQQSCEADNNYADKRRHDYGPAVQRWLQLLARKGLIEYVATEE